MGQRTGRGRNISGKISGRKRKKSKRYHSRNPVHYQHVSPVWVKSFPRPPWPSLLFPAPPSCAADQLAPLPAQPPTEKFPKCQPRVCSGAGGLKIAPADSPPSQINKWVPARDEAASAPLVVLWSSHCSLPLVFRKCTKWNGFFQGKWHNCAKWYDLFVCFIPGGEEEGKNVYLIWSKTLSFCFVFVVSAKITIIKKSLNQWLKVPYAKKVEEGKREVRPCLSLKTHLIFWHPIHEWGNPVFRRKLEQLPHIWETSRLLPLSPPSAPRCQCPLTPFPRTLSCAACWELPYATLLSQSPCRQHCA